jgi:hypothetical protein
MKYFILIILLISLKSFSQDKVGSLNSIDLNREFTVDSLNLNNDSVTIIEIANIQKQDLENIFPHDSSKKNVIFDKKLYKLNKEEFLNAYGTNDTSIAIINLFFKQRKIAKVLLLIEPITPVTAGGGVMVMWINSVGGYSSSFFSMYIGVSIMAVSVFGFVALPVAGAELLATWNRKRLYLILNDYNNKNKVIPKSVKKKLKNKYFKSN